MMDLKDYSKSSFVPIIIYISSFVVKKIMDIITPVDPSCRKDAFGNFEYWCTAPSINTTVPIIMWIITILLSVYLFFYMLKRGIKGLWIPISMILLSLITIIIVYIKSNFAMA
jgi:hypothetical protein